MTHQADPSNSVVRSKLQDAAAPGAVIEFDPAEADRVGAFQDDALSELEAAASAIDMPNNLPPVAFLRGEEVDPKTCPIPTHTTRTERE